MKKLTDWHPADVKPVHVGVYQTEGVFSGIVRYQKWGGDYWFRIHENQRAAKHESEKSVFQDVRWRGYTTKQD